MRHLGFFAIICVTLLSLTYFCNKASALPYGYELIIECSGTSGQCTTYQDGGVKNVLPGAFVNAWIICYSCAMPSPPSGDSSTHALWIDSTSTTGVGYAGSGFLAYWDPSSPSKITTFFDTTTSGSWQTYTDYNTWDSVANNYGGSIATGVRMSLKNTPGSMTLEQNYPNPFNNISSIEFRIADKELVGERVSLSIYDVSGNLMQTPYKGIADGNTHDIGINMSNMPAGNYIYQLKCGNSVVQNMMTVKR